MKVDDYSNKFDSTQYLSKYDHLSTFMSLKSSQIRWISNFVEYKVQNSNQVEVKDTEEIEQQIKPKKTALLKPEILSKKSHSCNPNSVKTERRKTVFPPRQTSFTKIPEVATGNHDQLGHGLLGGLDPLGVFIIDYYSEGIELCSSSLTEYANFLIKYSFDNAYKDWEDNIRTTFEILKELFGTLIRWKKTSFQRLLQASLVNWSYFDSLSNGYNLSDLEFI